RPERDQALERDRQQPPHVMVPSGDQELAECLELALIGGEGRHGEPRSMSQVASRKSQSDCNLEATACHQATATCALRPVVGRCRDYDSTAYQGRCQRLM